MGSKRALFLLSLVGAIIIPGSAAAQGSISLTIAKHAQITPDGVIVIEISVVCEPLPGTEDFREAFAGASQTGTGAEAEAGLDGTVVCDGIERIHTAHLSSFTEAFKRGPAQANVSLIVCNVDGDTQICARGGTQRQIVIRGPAAP